MTTVSPRARSDSPSQSGGQGQTRRAPTLPFKQHKGGCIFDDTTVAVGVGTFGLGDKCRDSSKERARLHYKMWLQAKQAEVAQQSNSGGNSGADGSVGRSPRDMSQRDRAAVEQARLQHEALLKQKAELVAKESREIKAMLEARRREEHALVHGLISNRKVGDAERRDTVLLAHEGERAAAIQQQKDDDREMHSQWKALARDEREAEQRRIAAAKEAIRLQHEASKQQIAAEREARLQKVREQKAAEDAKMERWRQEQQQHVAELHKETSGLRSELNNGTARARANFEQSKREEVDQARRENAKVKRQVEERQRLREQQTAQQALEAKRAAQSSYQQQVEELLTERRKAADEIKAMKRSLAEQRAIDAEERRAIAVELRQSVVSGHKAHS